MKTNAFVTAGLVLLIPRAAAACPVCFGASDGPILQGSNMGILALLIVTVGVLCAFGGFFFTLARRAARAVPEPPAAVETIPQAEGNLR
jgi:hypothetical protein